MFAYDSSIGKYQFDLEAAANYLKAAPNPAQPGKSYADTGFTMTLFYNAGNLPRETACQLLKAGMMELKTKGLINGTITMDVMGLDWPAYLAKVQGKELPAFFLGWAPDYADPDNYVNPFLHSSGTYAKRCADRQRHHHCLDRGSRAGTERDRQDRPVQGHFRSCV